LRNNSKVYDVTARIAAETQDHLRAAGYIASPLAGIPVSIKDLFDVAGETTLAGSRALGDAPPVWADAPVVARLKAAGAIIMEWVGSGRVTLRHVSPVPPRSIYRNL
jgi:aspartyl-tRNA(Asn)/glutamyl-tRNA(Gln) amidotransferase subunit A